MQALTKGSIGVQHYCGILRQIFHHTRENPQIQALASVYFRGNQREVVKSFFQHAASEIGHDQLALNDLKALGQNVDQIPFENPLPATTALLSFPFFQITQKNPVGYLGYLFFLEYTPTTAGAMYIQKLLDIGIPTEAMTFLQDHTTIDVSHNRLMERYVEELVVTKCDLEAVSYAIQVTGELYGRMLDGAMKQEDSKVQYGINCTELSLSCKKPRAAAN